EAAGFKILYCRYTQGAAFWTVSVINELRALGVTEVSARRPSLENPLTPLLHVTFALLDFVRMPFSKTSQMNICLTWPDRPAFRIKSGIACRRRALLGRRRDRRHRRGGCGRREQAVGLPICAGPCRRGHSYSPYAMRFRRAILFEGSFRGNRDGKKTASS